MKAAWCMALACALALGMTAATAAPRHKAKHNITAVAPAPAHRYVHPNDQCIANTDPDVICAYGVYQGRDPDPNVRLELRRDAGHWLGGPD